MHLLHRNAAKLSFFDNSNFSVSDPIINKFNLSYPIYSFINRKIIEVG